MLNVLDMLLPDHAALSLAARRALQDAVRSARHGERARALAALDEAIAQAGTIPAARVIAAQVRYALGQYQLAQDELDAAASVGAEAHADEVRYRFVAQLGWNQDAREIVERRLAARGRDARVWHGRAVRLFGHLRYDEAALAHLDPLLALSPPSAALELNAAHLCARTGDFEGARAHAERAVTRDGASVAIRAAAALSIAEGGFWAEALAHAERALELSDGAPVHALRGRLALWALELDGAEAHARRAIEIDPELAEAHRSLGAIAALRGDYERALAALDQAERCDPDDAETRVWRAEVFLRMGSFDSATEEVDRALARSDRHLLAAQAIRLLATLESEREKTHPLKAPSFGELREGCAEVLPESRAIFADGDRAKVAAALEAVLARLGGNRGGRATWIAEPGAHPRPIRARSGARFASRHALDLIRVAPADDVLRWLTEIEARHPDSSLPAAHRGEANLWLGRYEDALSDLERALSINRHTRWAYIGMTALEIVQGRAEAALAVSALGVERMRSTGPAVYVHRGEALRLAGRVDEAIADLEVALELNPRRLSASINLALAWQAAGRAELAKSEYRDLLERAPGLLSDAALAIGADDWRAPELDGDTRERVLASALSLMRGNRSSSCPTYVTPRGVLRTVPAGSRSAPQLVQTAEVALEQAAHWLSRAGRRSR